MQSKIILDDGFLQELFATGDCAPLLAALENETQSHSQNGKNSNYNFIFNFIMDQAIHNNADIFIRNLFFNTHIVSYLNHELLFEYAQKQGAKFLNQAVEAMVNNPGPEYPPALVHSFYKCARKFFISIGRSDSPEAVESPYRNFIVQILSNSQITFELKKAYLVEWVRAYFDMVSELDFENKKAVWNAFFNNLSQNKDELLQVLKNIFFLYVVPEICKMTLVNFLGCVECSSDEIVSVLQGVRIRQETLALLPLLIDKIDQKHHSHRDFKMLSDFLICANSERASYLLANPGLLLTNIIPDLQRYLIKLLTTEDKKYFIEWYIDHPHFEAGSLFSEYIFETDKQTITRFLNAPHVKLPEMPLKTLINIDRTDQVVDLIRLLLARTDYNCTINDLFWPLFQLIERGCKESVSLLLEHPAIFNLLKSYYEVKGDDFLSRENRGQLMPVVAACYISSSEKYLEFFLAFAQDKQNELLKGCVPSFIDSQRPSLRAYIIQSGKSDLLRALGGIHPRLLVTSASTKPSALIPNLWRNPLLTEWLRNHQRKTAIQFAKNRSEQLSYLQSPALEIQQQTIDAAKQYSGYPLIFQHQTKLNNALPAFQDGHLKSHLHIEGHSVAGKASNGLGIGPYDYPQNNFCYFTHTSLAQKPSSITNFQGIEQKGLALFVINARQFLVNNPQINFLVIGLYPYIAKKIMKFACGYELVVDPSKFEESAYMIRVEWKSHENALVAICQKMFELVFVHLINDMPELLKSQTIQKLLHPKNEQERQLGFDLLDLLPLEWLIPGDATLKLSYVEKIEYGEKTFNLSVLREIAINAGESQVLTTINTFEHLQQLPFVIDGLLNIAIQRRHATVVKKLLAVKPITAEPYTIRYYPKVIYEIESLVQLILEDLDNDRVYLHYLDNQIIIHSTLKINTNIGGAHHAQMAHLHCALGLDDFERKNSLDIFLPDMLSLSLGNNERFKTPEEVRDKLLTFELTTLLVSQQNADYHQKNGRFHPYTGKGSTNGLVALMKERLFFNETAYQIKVNCQHEIKKIEIRTSLIDTAKNIAMSLENLLGLEAKNIVVVNELILLNIEPASLIAKLRRHAIFYEGINIITNDGRLLLAERHGKGLASAGGHHGDKYCKKGIAYGLYSEFSLMFKEPSLMDTNIRILSSDKSNCKVAIYTATLDSLVPTSQAIQHASKNEMDVIFKADPDEFVPNSEVALSLIQMRGKKFYDVMPIAELCEDQLQRLKDYIKKFTDSDKEISISIDSFVSSVVQSGITYKIPSSNFGLITINVCSETINQIEKVFCEKGTLLPNSNQSCRIYTIEGSPLMLIREIEYCLEATEQVQPRC